MTQPGAAHGAADVAVVTGRPREVWIDSARGACVLAVVLFHVCLWQYLPMRGEVWPTAIEGWTKINGYLASLRMPLLMAISGMLARRRILAGWGRPGAAVRAASSYYLYVVWLLVYALYYLVTDRPQLPHHIGGVGELLRQLVLPETPLWFILALAVYVVVLTTGHRVPPRIVVAVLALLAVVVTASNPHWPMFEKVPENFVYFALGVHGAAWLRALIQRRRPRDLLVALAVGAGSIVLAKWNFGAWGDAVVEVARGAVFIVAGGLVVSSLVRWSLLGRVGSAVGRQTLPIYVFHAPVLMTAMIVLDDATVRSLGSVLRNPVVAVLWPLALTALVVGCCLALHRALVMIRLGVLFEMPAAWAAAIARRWSDHSASGVAAPPRTGDSA